MEQGWKKLNELIGSLGPDGLAVRGSDGWAVKDHLFHIAAWELSMVALFEGGDRALAMGVPGLDGTEEINEAVWKAHRDETGDAARSHSRLVHERLVGLLTKLSDADLALSYNHYQPNDPKQPPAGDRPVSDWVGGNTYEHYSEHIGWISELVAQRR